MNRKDFLNIAWVKWGRPVLFLAVIYFCFQFLIHLVNENGTERKVVFFCLFFVIIYLIGLIFYLFFNKISELIPARIKIWLKKGAKFVNFLSPVILGIVIYHLWLEDWIGVSILVSVLLLQKVIAIVESKNKTKLNQ